jgi:acyl-CoA dehydrogenase
VFVPLDFIIGGPKMAGHGWRMLMECLGAGRAISLPSNTTGASRLGVYTTGAYARIRKQFRLPIARFDGVDEVLGRMGGTLYAMEAVRTMTAGAIDQGEAPAVCAAISKLHVTEMARHVGNDAMDVHGGKGIQLGPSNYLGRGYQSIPIAITVEGANILTRNLMIYGQGAIRSHPYVLKEMRAAADEDHHHALMEFDQALFGHMGLAFSNAARSVWMALTSARFSRVPVSTPTERYYQHINRFSAAFVLASDAAMLSLGGALKKKEKLSARLGDMLSYLYIASAALKRFEDQNRPAEDLPLVEYACRDALYRFQESMHSFLRNFPNRPVAVVLRALIFPRGRSYSAPSDHLGHQIAELISMPGASRDRLTRNTYTGDAHSPVGMFAEALGLATKLEPVEHRIRDAEKAGQLKVGRDTTPVLAAEAAGLLKPDEVKDLLRLDELTAHIIAVDDFDPMDLGTHPFTPAKA